MEEVAALPNDVRDSRGPRFRKTPMGETVEAQNRHVTAFGIGLAMEAYPVRLRTGDVDPDGIPSESMSSENPTRSYTEYAP